MAQLRIQLRRSILRLLIFLRKIKPPGFRGVGLYDVLSFFFRALGDPKFNLMASAMSYQFFFSLFPTLLLMFLVLPYFPIEGFREEVLELVFRFLPVGSGLVDEVEISRMAESLVANYFDRATSIWLVVLTTFLALFGATRGIIAMMKAFTKKESFFKKRNLGQLYGTALVIFIVLVGLVLFGVGLQILGAACLDYLATDLAWMGPRWQSFWGESFRLLVSVVFTFMVISILYFLAPATAQRWKFFSPGAILAAVLALLAIYGLEKFFLNFANFDVLYGSLAAIILLMVWFYYLSIVLLIGFELNVAIDIASRQKGRRIKPKPVQTVDDGLT